jgi:hypothetical protein
MIQMSIDPKWAFIFNIIALVLSVLAGAAWWGDVVGAHTAAVLTGIMNTGVAAINSVLSAYSAPRKGFMAT